MPSLVVRRGEADANGGEAGSKRARSDSFCQATLCQLHDFLLQFTAKSLNRDRLAFVVRAPHCRGVRRGYFMACGANPPRLAAHMLEVLLDADDIGQVPEGLTVA